MRQRAARDSCVLRVGLLPGADPGSRHTAVRTLNRGTRRCLRPFERPGPVTRRARRLRGTRGPQADAHGGRIAQARAAHNARSGIPRFTVSIWYAAQHPAGGPKRLPEAVSGVPSTVAHARRIIFDIAPVFARGTFLQCLHGARFNLADGYVAT
ncbi:hypothetical protein F3J12_10030 [Burkholderia sp. Ax-1735]|nr:hypothetical protein [Burkholderia sp. Ap-955]NIF09879.1 hypothetical protein [Burkholderia sp. Ax-1735]NIG02955.1 hypothetical protein [Burkholderia sp. Tr-849]